MMGLGVTKNTFRKRGLTDTVYLQWQNDPLTTMTVHWHVTNPIDDTLLYRKEGTEDWVSKICDIQDILLESLPLVYINKLEIVGLESGQGYEFKFEGDSEIRKFKTMPKNLDRPIRIASASDSHDYHKSDYFNDLTEQMGGVGFDADMVVSSGDLTYDDGKIAPKQAKHWSGLMLRLSRYFIDSEGYLIPFISGYGNHDTKVQKMGGVFGEDDAHNFDSLFSFPMKEDYPTQNKSYGTLKFGDYLRLIILDTNHKQPFEGEQKEWFDEVATNDTFHTIIVMHVPLYGFREGKSWKMTSRIKMWGEAIENSGAKIVMQGHMHSYMVTHPLLNDEVNENGVTFCGDGTWGWLRDSVLENELPYFVADAKFNNTDQLNASHFWGMTLDNEKIIAKAINPNGETFNTIERII